MTEDEKYLFDLNGYLIVEEVLTPDEIARANEAVDRQRAVMEPPYHTRLNRPVLDA